MEPPPAKKVKSSQAEQSLFIAKDTTSGPDTLFYDNDFPWDEELKVGGVEWRRPKEICSEPKFIVDGATRMDVCQGKLSNCWFLSAVACLSLYPQLLKMIVPPAQEFLNSYTGKFIFQFWQYGEWIQVEIDDLLPTIRSNEGTAHGASTYDLLFMHSKERNEFWSSLLEKAYAKLKGGYSALQLGFAGEALVDMTGGVVQTCDTNLPPANLSEYLNHLLLRGALICCGNTQGELETANSMGILSHHMYSITGAKQVQTFQGSVSLLRVRNPWGHTEWTGPWRDSGPEWLCVIDTEDIEFESLEDGEFWMEVGDFQKNFQVLEICHLGPESLSRVRSAARPWEYVVYEGCWVKGISAGGSIDCKENFWMNPQYSLSLISEDNDPSQECSFIVSVMQKYKRRKGNNTFVVCHIFQGSKDHVYLTQEIFQCSQPLLTAGSSDKHREVVLCSSLPPGRYVIIPSLQRVTDEGEFLIRILTEKGSCVSRMDSIAPCSESVPLSVSLSEVQCHSRFLEFSTPDGRLTDEGLHNLLTSLMADFAPFLPCFTLESSRCLLASMDTRIEGSLCWEQFTKLWKNIISGTIIFSNIQREQTEQLDKEQIGPALQSAGLTGDEFIVRLTQLKYGDKDGCLNYPAFICCLLKLKAVTGKLHA
ncbi:hypothetical protein GDO86_015810 [Hymenochirus boettgeri]|uniref:Calpain catalytic domain-containing protein n=1 Tax=Hymenochirus boettgeri TaxID=247094 RepID=A0A8T2K0D6_9PIPI|nr:hypothetical protein GDO86_015810 [Hymenochirus boettgeri]